jgi:hypothetical protein
MRTRVGRFRVGVAQPRLVTEHDLDLEYRAMAADVERERDAIEAEMGEDLA